MVVCTPLGCRVTTGAPTGVPSFLPGGSLPVAARLLSNHSGLILGNTARLAQREKSRGKPLNLSTASRAAITNPLSNRKAVVTTRDTAALRGRGTQATSVACVPGGITHRAHRPCCPCALAADPATSRSQQAARRPTKHPLIPNRVPTEPTTASRGRCRDGQRWPRGGPMPDINYVLLIVGAWLAVAACFTGVCILIERHRR